MIRNGANRDDPNMKEYFESLESIRYQRRPVDFNNLKGKTLAMEHNCICPVCKESLFNGEDLHVHHIQEKKSGGPDRFSNYVLLHSITYGSDKEEWRIRFEQAKQIYEKRAPVEDK